MATLTPQQVDALLLQVGFTPQAAATMTAISRAESDYNDTAVGDVNLEDSTWGPSYGLFQVRTQKAATGSGGVRDLLWLEQSDLDQAKAAYQISKQGTDFTAWSTFNNGSYATTLASLQATLAGNTATVQPAGLTSGLVSQITTGARNIGIEAAFVALGLALVAAGLGSMVAPKVRQVTAKGQKIAGDALKVAAL